MDKFKELVKKYKIRRNLRSFFASQISQSRPLTEKCFHNLQKSQTSLFVQKWSYNNITQVYLETLNLIDTYIQNVASQTIESYLNIKNHVKRLIFQCGLSTLPELIQTQEHFFHEVVFTREQLISPEIAFLLNHLGPLVHIVSMSEEQQNHERIQKQGDPSVRYWFEDIPTLGHHTYERYYGLYLCLKLHSSSKVFLRIRLITMEDPPNQLHNWTPISSKIQTTITLLRESGNVPESFYIPYFKTLSVKRLLINPPQDLVIILKQNYVRYIKQKTFTMSALVKAFLTSQPQIQADILSCFLIDENQLTDTQVHTAFLLQDMICGDSQLSQYSNNPTWTAQGQAAVDLYKLIHFQCRRHLKSFKTKALARVKQLNNDDDPEINIEQQIQILDVPDTVRRRAMDRQKEGTSRNNESSQKALTWVQNLLKIPFGTYRREPCLTLADECVNTITTQNPPLFQLPDADAASITPKKWSLNSVDQMLQEHAQAQNIIEPTGHLTAPYIKSLVNTIASVAQAKSLATQIGATLTIRKNSTISNIRNQIGKQVGSMEYPENCASLNIDGTPNKNIMENIALIAATRNKLQRELTAQRAIMEKQVYAQEEVKKETMRIVGQWMTGENTGYCLGFEGPPGVGKTTLAKEALAQILHDAEGARRPFKFLALGGGANGSTLEGHNQTQVGSTWGQIVDALMDAKCLNPIIQFDELDKVSKTEHGREIIGILTHMTDPSQNAQFHDKQFQGVPIDLSKALIIFSQNDPSQIDPILLDRIHRIQFRPLTPSQKTTIARNYLLPGMRSSIGINNSVRIDDSSIRRIVDQYTNECGVRTLKEQLQSILREWNLQYIENGHRGGEIGWDFIARVLEKEVPELRRQCTGEGIIGSVTGMQATKYSGGTMPIQCLMIQGKEDFELTGNQGAVMKESMRIAKSISLQLYGELRTNPLFQNTQEGLGELPEKLGWHIHVPDGATPKDGPSGGFAITTAMLSTLLGLPVRDSIAFTGEIDLAGNIRAIGGLDKKFTGAVAHGVRKVFIPFENMKDVDVLERDDEFRADVLNNLEICFVRNIRDAVGEIQELDNAAA